jgi:hypothetical protein
MGNRNVGENNNDSGEYCPMDSVCLIEGLISHVDHVQLAWEIHVWWV